MFVEVQLHRFLPSAVDGVKGRLEVVAALFPVATGCAPQTVRTLKRQDPG